MFSRDTIFIGLMLAGTLATADLINQEKKTGSEAGYTVGNKMPTYESTRAVHQDTPTLQLDKLTRTKPSHAERNIFANNSLHPPPKVQITQNKVQITQNIVQEIIQPTAPPLPFRYIGRMVEEDGQVTVYLAQGNRSRSVKIGDSIDGMYRLDGIFSGHLVLTYLPLEIKQTLSIVSALSPNMGGLTSIGVASTVASANLLDQVSAQNTGVQP